MKKVLTVLYHATFAPLVHAFRAVGNIFKKDFWKKEDWAPILEHFEWSFKLYFLVFVIPLSVSVIYLFHYILIGDAATPLWQIWADYFVTGYFCDIAAWRWQIALFVFANIMTLANNWDDTI